MNHRNGEPTVSYTKWGLRRVNLDHWCLFFAPLKKESYFSVGLSFPLLLMFTSYRFIPIVQMQGTLAPAPEIQMGQSLSIVSFPPMWVSRAYVLPLCHSGHILSSFHGKALHVKHFPHSCRIFWGILMRTNVHPRSLVTPTFPGPLFLKLPFPRSRSHSFPYTMYHTQLALYFLSFFASTQGLHICYSDIPPESHFLP